MIFDDLVWVERLLSLQQHLGGFVNPCDCALIINIYRIKPIYTFISNQSLTISPIAVIIDEFECAGAAPSSHLW